jgi:hypothetical protein
MEAAQVMGLAVDVQKAKQMEVTKKTNSKMLKMDDQEYERIKEL